MRPLSVHIDVTHVTATPAQPDPQTVHLNSAQSWQQRKKLPLPGTELPAVETARPPQSQQQREKMPLSEADFAAVGAASLPQFSQQRKEMPLPEIYPSTMGAAYSSHPQPQRREMPLSETEILAPPIAEISSPADSAAALPGEPLSNAPLSATPLCAAVPHTASCALLLQTADIPPPLFAATTRGLPRTSCFVLATLCRRL